MAMDNLTLLGGGVLGTQIAFQSAFCGKNVTIWLRSEGSIGRTKPKLEHVKNEYLKAIDKMDETRDENDLCAGIADSYDGFDAAALKQRVEKAAESLTLELDLAKAVSDADLVIEAMAENKDAKTEMFRKVAPVLPEKTIIVTNSSSLLPSKFTKCTGRPDRYLALHFANEIWKNNTAEVMAVEGTSDASFQSVVQFAEDINMVPLQLHKEKAGYLLNSMLIPLMESALDLYVNGISDPETIDKAWCLATGAPIGPMHIFDIVGLETAYNVTKPYTKIPSFIAPYNFKGQVKLLKEYIDQGKTGVNAGEGFFKYDKEDK